MRQMGVDQTLPIIDGVDADARLSPGVIRVLLAAWVRGNRLIHPLPDPTLVKTTPDYQEWLRTVVWPIERPRLIALLREVEGWDKDDIVVKETPKTPRKEAPGMKRKVPEIIPVTEDEEEEEKEYAPRRKRAT